jgi:hypothetical protein
MDILGRACFVNIKTLKGGFFKDKFASGTPGGRWARCGVQKSGSELLVSSVLSMSQTSTSGLTSYKRLSTSGIDNGKKDEVQSNESLGSEYFSTAAKIFAT